MYLFHYCMRAGDRAGLTMQILSWCHRGVESMTVNATGKFSLLSILGYQLQQKVSGVCQTRPVNLSTLAMLQPCDNSRF